MEKSVLVAMSGGVDSSVAALLLQKQGWKVAGATFQLFDGCNENNVKDAAAVCAQLGIEHHVLDYRALFREKVLDYFASSYHEGETPNPCVACNKNIKFGMFAQDTISLGFTHISTGHYARILYNEEQARFGLHCSQNKKKDQSYVLYHLSQQQLAMLVLPVADFTKDEVRAFAADAGLGVTSKSDSQDICFVPDGDYVSFIEKHTGCIGKEGDFVDDNGDVIGRHKGVLHYTIGQRKGLGVSFGRHRYVSALDAKTNTVVLSDEDAVFSRELFAKNLHMIVPFDVKIPIRAQVKIRYAHTPSPAMIYFAEMDVVRVVFDVPQRAITAGQAIVFYDGDEVLGGATICGKSI